MDENIARKAVAAAKISSSDTVLEIGPGRGVLTKFLLPLCRRLIAVEVDSELARELKARFPQVEIHCADILRFSLQNLNLPPRSVKVVANIPYAITGAILEKILPWDSLIRAVFMLQKEVAQRILAKPSSPDYGILTLSANFYGEARKIWGVPRSCFRPIPKVNSMLIRFEPYQVPRFQGLSERNFFRVVKAAFGKRRKTLANALSMGLPLSKQKILEILERCRIANRSRAENISLEGFANLADALFDRQDKML